MYDVRTEGGREGVMEKQKKGNGGCLNVTVGGSDNLADVIFRRPFTKPFSRRSC